MDYNERCEINEEYTWDLTSRYKNDAAWEKDYEDTKKIIKKIAKYENTLGKSDDNVLDALDMYYDLDRRITKLYVYASLKHDEDLKVSKYSLCLSKAYTLFNEFSMQASFIKPELLSLSKGKLNGYIKSKTLTKYKFLLKQVLREKDHTLNKSESKLFSLLTSTNNSFDKLCSILIDSTLDFGKILIDGNEVVITNSNYRNIMTNKDRKVRIKCYELMTKKLKEFTNIFGETLSNNMKSYSNMAKALNYKSTLDMQLFSSNIPTKVVDNLYSTVNKRLSVFQKYLLLLQKNLGLEKLNYYDLSAEFLTGTNTFSIEDAEMLIGEATKIYGDEYHNVIEKAFKDRWIDYCSYKGKKSGAYSTSNYPDDPVVLTNFHGKFTDVSAVAHELGHAVNFYLSEKNNNAHDYVNDIFVAEVASLTNEIILSNYIINNTNNKSLKLEALYNLIDIIQNNLFDACLEGELENEMYKFVDNSEEVDSEAFSNCIYNLRKKYYGKMVELDDNVRYMWARRSHYYYPFYLFQYATGVSAAIWVATKILSNDDKIKNKYLKFLSSGSTDYPINLLKDLGIDMSDPIVIDNAINYFECLIDKFNKVSEE